MWRCQFPHGLVGELGQGQQPAIESLQGPRELEPWMQEAASLVLRASAGLAALASPSGSPPASTELSRWGRGRHGNVGSLFMAEEPLLS